MSEPLAVSTHHHMHIRWHNLAQRDSVPVTEASLTARAAVVGRVGIMMLACGTGAWRVREAMDRVSRRLHLTCSADVGLIAISFTCFENGHHYSQTLSLAASGVNTDKLSVMETFVDHFDSVLTLTPQEIHTKLDGIQQKPGNYTPALLGLASAAACAAFVFLLGGGPIEMLGCFVGAGIGNWLRAIMGRHHMTVIASTALSVAAACLAYLAVFAALAAGLHIRAAHEAGYIGAMLFVIPGFPFITSGLDICKQDMRSGLERGAFAIMVITVATITGWLVAVLVHLQPADFIPLGLGRWSLLAGRLIASFVGVYGFSIMFNSPVKMAASAGLIGAAANTLRLTLIDWAAMPPTAAAFLGALLAGLLASAVHAYRRGFPRISLTVPAIVIMVPGLYMYRGMYALGLNHFAIGGSWLVRAIMIVVALPLGLAMARILTDKKWRHIS